MKKGDVIQLAVIILALIIAINSLQYLVGSLIGLVYSVASTSLTFTVLIPTIISLLVTMLYIAICWQLLVKSRSIADFIYEKTGIGTSFKILSRPDDLLFILFIMLGFYFLLDELPVLIKAIVNAFKTKAAGTEYYEKPADWGMLFIRLLLPTILLMAARPIANYFSRNISEEPVMVGDNIGNIQDEETNEP